MTRYNFLNRVCPLCENSVSHFKTNSHIIPEWMYKGIDIYDEKGKIIELDFQNNKKSFLQKGYRGDFICDNCEKETAELDSYASRIFKGDNHSQRFKKQEKYSDKLAQQTPVHTNLEKIYFWNGFNFKKLQSFIYSIYLRQHFYNLSKNNKSLIIDKHLYPILELYRSESVDDETYPIFIFCFPTESLFYKTIVSPYVDKINGHHVIQFTACGFYFILKISSHTGLFDDSIKLKSDGSIYIGQIKPENTGIIKKANLQVRQDFPIK